MGGGTGQLPGKSHSDPWVSFQGCNTLGNLYLTKIVWMTFWKSSEEKAIVIKYSQRSTAIISCLLSIPLSDLLKIYPLAIYYLQDL